MAALTPASPWLRRFLVPMALGFGGCWWVLSLQRPFSEGGATSAGRAAPPEQHGGKRDSDNAFQRLIALEVESLAKVDLPWEKNGLWEELIAAKLRSASVAEIESVSTSFLKVKDIAKWLTLQRGCLVALARKDPLAAAGRLNFLNATGNGRSLSYRPALEGVGRSLSRYPAAQQAQALAKIQNSECRRELAWLLIGHSDEIRPERLGGFLAEAGLPDEVGSEGANVRTAEAMGKLAGARALEWALDDQAGAAGKAGRLKEVLMGMIHADAPEAGAALDRLAALDEKAAREVVATWAAADSKTCREWIDRQPADRQSGFMDGLVRGLAQEDAVAALKLAAIGQSDRISGATLGDTANLALAADPDAALGMLRKLGSGALEKCLASVVDPISDDFDNPALARRCLTELPLSESKKQEWLKALILREIERNPDSAPILSGITDPAAIEESITLGKGLAMAGAHPDAGWKTLQALAVPRGDAAMADFLGAVTRLNWEWAYDLAVGSRRQADPAVFRALVTSARGDDAWKAAELACAMPADSADGSRSAQVVGELARTLADQDLDRAGEWAVKLPNAGMREAALKMLTRAWSEADPAGYSRWIVQQEPGVGRDAMIEALLGAIPSDPERQFQWAGTIGDPVKRDRWLKRTLIQWGRLDPAAADRASQSLSH